jgi:tRNA(Ile)-lysidine synthase TilS/MesJ
VFRKDDRILVIDPLTAFLIQRIVGDLPFKMYTKKYDISQLNSALVKTYIKKNGINKVIIPWTMDDECCNFLEYLFLGKTASKLKFYSLLLTMTDEEALLLASHNNISFKPLKKNKEIRAILRTLEEKYPETKFSLVKSAEEMQKIFRK